jgi:transposase
MAYREVGMMDIDQVIRRWLAGEKIRAIARLTGTDRNTVRRIVRLAEEAGIRGETPWPDEGKLQQIRQRMGRPGAAVATSGAEQQLKSRTEQIRAWLEKDHLLLTKVHELLGREGLLVSYSALYRFVRKWCGFGTSSISVRRAESPPGEMAEADFGRLGALQELGSCQPRMVQGFIVTLSYSRLSCVIPAFKQDLPTVIDCFERAWVFFGGCPRRVVIDGMKACIEQADPYTPRFNRTFLEYANYRGFLPDPARPAHPQDKPVVENCVPYVRQRFFKGETFVDLDDVARRALVWCREVAGRRIHGTTRRVPLEVFEAEEKRGERHLYRQWLHDRVEIRERQNDQGGFLAVQRRQHIFERNVIHTPDVTKQSAARTVLGLHQDCAKKGSFARSIACPVNAHSNLTGRICQGAPPMNFIKRRMPL